MLWRRRVLLIYIRKHFLEIIVVNRFTPAIRGKYLRDISRGHILSWGALDRQVIMDFENSRRGGSFGRDFLNGLPFSPLGHEPKEGHVDFSNKLRLEADPIIVRVRQSKDDAFQPYITIRIRLGGIGYRERLFATLVGPSSFASSCRNKTPPEPIAIAGRSPRDGPYVPFI